MFGSVEILVLTVFFWFVSVWVFYMIIKAAVRNGILEADAQRRSPRRPYANLTYDEIQQRIAEHRAQEPGQPGDTP
ncbi:hypothetical protein GCM10011584_09960 [Nocardioides phosphati]|uniref:SHOCT domain-containing protein n=1 Tax=Nocardioides phosphati TaxID=1867775 RepID=A0ABQ2N6X7_9ACTN|nr:hypothetical protein [Nocardioides phosphati]GGO86820.1 hypothetical protein GCM10011584_09960 [Nocardioides phosphati]